MLLDDPGSRFPHDRRHLHFPFRSPRRLTRRQVLLCALLLLVVLSGVIGGWSTGLFSSHAAGPLPGAPASMTFAQYLKQGRNDGVYRGPIKFPHGVPAVQVPKGATAPSSAQFPPSAEPATMKPISQALDASFLAGSTGASPLDLAGSDGRLEVHLQPGSLDLSHASGAAGSALSGALTFQLSQNFGHFEGMFNLLGSYQVQVVDSQGQVINGIQMHAPATFVYHYQPAELLGLNLDPAHILISWPTLIAAAQQAKLPTTGMSSVMSDDPVAHTLTGQSMVLGPASFDLGGDPANQAPPIPHLGSVQGNTGQLSYSYPLQVPPGTGGFAPPLLLTYSSSNTNERHSPHSPAGDEGEGWSLSLGSITSEVYPTSPNPTTWYFLNGIDNSGDRLILYDSTNLLYYTEHLSYLRVQQVTSSVTTQPCFKVWDTSGTYYELGCTLDSLQYSTDSSGTRHNYQWDVNKIVAPNEGSSSPSYKLILVSYLQDCTPTAESSSTCPSGTKTIRDAVMKQIVYGYASSTNVSSLASTATAGTVDFSYYAPFNYSPWAQAYYQYPSNYTCSNTPPASTSLRCDDPINYPGPPSVTAPTVMSTFSPISVTSYVGTDSSTSTTAYSYDFTFQDRSFYQDGSPWPCKDPTTLNKEYCAGEHLLTGITPSVWQNGTKHLLKGMSLTYSPYTGTGSLQNTYYDSLHQVGSPAQPYQNTTYWQYLTDYQDLNTGVGEHITYARAYNNTDGTPNQYDEYGNIIDDRFDALYCTTHANDLSTLRCTGNYAHPDDHAWSEYVVTQLKSWGQDSSALLPAITTFNYYRLAQTGTYNGGAWCYPDPQNRENACVGDNWLPQGDSDWQDYYHGEFRGFAQVWITSPASDLTIDYYFSTKGWYTAANDPLNYNAGQLQQEETYTGTNNISTTLLSRTTYTYATSANACYTPAGSSPYAACDLLVLSSRTTQYEGSTSSNPPWLEHDDTYDDYSSGGGLQAGYHNLTQDAVSTSTGTSYTRKWTYTPNNRTVGNWTYYDVNKITHSEVDAGSTVWQCQDATYDEGSGAPNTPAAGWPTTLTGHSDCSNLSGSAITSFVGYDQFGNTVASVDGVATANSSLYGSNGCTLATAPRVKSSNWSQTLYELRRLRSQLQRPAGHGNQCLWSSRQHQLRLYTRRTAHQYH